MLLHGLSYGIVCVGYKDEQTGDSIRKSTFYRVIDETANNPPKVTLGKR